MAKKISNLMIINLLCFLMLNCMNKSGQTSTSISNASATGTTTKVGATNQIVLDGCTESAVVAKGQLLIIKLPAVAGTGYSWHLKGALSVLKPITQDVIQYEDDKSENMPGKASKQVLTFSAEKLGTETLDLVYKRSFGNEEAADKCSIKITVQ